MKKLSVLIVSLLISFAINAQTKSNLSVRVDSIIKNVLNYIPGAKPVIKNNGDYKADTLVSYVTREAAVTIPDGPLIIINKKLVDYKILNNYTLQDVKDINVLARDAAVEAYGPQGLHGAVLIALNKKK